MSIATGDMQSVGTFGWWYTSSTPAAPSRPTLALANDGTGTAITATVSGDAGVTHRLYYRVVKAGQWTTGATRVGNGDIAQAGLTANTLYEFLCVSDDTGIYSLPSLAERVYTSDGSSPTTLQAALDYELRADGGLAALVSTRIYQGYAPQHTAQPYLIFQRVSETVSHYQLGDSGIVDALYQFRIVAKTSAAAEGIFAALRAVLDNERRTFGESGATVTISKISLEGDFEDFDDPQDAGQRGAVNIVADYRFWYRE